MRHYQPVVYEQDNYLVKVAASGDIYDFFDLNEEDCFLLYRDPDVDYLYAYHYALAFYGEHVVGSCMCIDRFYPLGERYAKEIYVYELCVFEGRNEAEVSAAAKALLGYLRLYAQNTGSGRISLRIEGADPLSSALFAACGYQPTNGRFILALPEVELLPHDALVVPTGEDALSFRSLYYLSENYFTVTPTECVLQVEDKTITVNRHTAEVRFSSNVRIEGDHKFYLFGERELAMIDALRQLFMRRAAERVLLFDPHPERETVPDLLIDDDWGIFVDKCKGKNRQERKEWEQRLLQKGIIRRYSLHTLHFDEEVGGSITSLGYILLH